MGAVGSGERFSRGGLSPSGGAIGRRARVSVEPLPSCMRNAWLERSTGGCVVLSAYMPLVLASTSSLVALCPPAAS